MRGGVVPEVAQGGAELVFFDALEGVGAGGPADAVDVSVIEVPDAGSEPFVLAVQQHELQQAGEVVQVLAGVDRSTIWVAPGNLAPAMFQIQAAPSPRIVNWRT